MSKKRPLPPERFAECAAAHALFLSKKKALKLSQKKIAEVAGITPSAVNLYLKGLNPLNAKFAVVLSRLLEEPIAKFSPRLAQEIEALAMEPTRYYGNAAKNAEEARADFATIPKQQNALPAAEGSRNSEPANSVEDGPELANGLDAVADVAVGAPASFVITRIYALSLDSGECRIRIQGHAETFYGTITDTALSRPNSVYTQAMHNSTGLNVTARPVYKDGELYRLFIIKA